MAVQQCGGVGDDLWAGEHATWAARLLGNGQDKQERCLGRIQAVPWPKLAPVVTVTARADVAVVPRRHPGCYQEVTPARQQCLGLHPRLTQSWPPMGDSHCPAGRNPAAFGGR